MHAFWRAAALALAIASAAALPADFATAHAADLLPPSASPADAIVASLGDPALRDLLAEVLERHPEIHAARARFLAAVQVAPQERALPDPLLEVMGYARSPDGRQAAFEYSQEVPGAGKRRLASDAASQEADAAEADLEALRLRLVTEAREAWIELARLHEDEEIVREERAALERFESLARARYEAGEGLQHDVVRLQAEITRSELELVEFESERIMVAVELNALRGRTGDMDVPSPRLPATPATLPTASHLSAAAAAMRPELRAAQARVAAAASRIELAHRQRKPDLMLTGGWMLMEGGDMSGKGGGLESDEFTLGVGIRLPVRGRKIAAGIEQSVQERQAALAERDAAALAIDREAWKEASRFALLRRRLELNEGVLAIQAGETQRSAEAAYATGLAGSLELLESERELFAVRRESLGARADLARIVARLEGVVAAPLAALVPVARMSSETVTERALPGQAPADGVTP